MASSFEKLKELNLSRDEVERIGEALKKPQFRQLLTEYVEELQDPENRKLYQEELRQLEKERGVDVTFIDPKPGYVIKTSCNGNQKAFVNICCSEHVDKPSSTPTVKEGTRGLSWSVPHSLSKPREDVDNKGVRCQVYDVVFHPDTLHLALKNQTFKTMVNDTALDAVENNFDVKLDKKNVKFPKLPYKGVPQISAIRKPCAKPERTPEETEIYNKIFAKVESNASPIRKSKRSRRNSLEDKTPYTTPKYIVKQRSHVVMQDFTEDRHSKLNTTIPNELIVEIDLPLLKYSTDITLDVTEKVLQIISEKPAKYKLNLTLPYSVIEANGTAKFNKDLKQLVVVLPVKRNQIEFDSGVESDNHSPGSPQSEDEERVTVVNETEQEVERTLHKDVEKFKFFDSNIIYSLPEFTCHVFENIIAFTLHVKNVDESSVQKTLGNDFIAVKFVSIGSSFYPCHYAFCVKLPELIRNEQIEIWDNNVVVQLTFDCDKELKSYFYGVNDADLKEKFVETPEIINKIMEEIQEITPPEELKKSEEKERTESQDIPQSESSDHNYLTGTSYESSGDELSCVGSFSPRKSKGILKRFSSIRQVGRSISESSLDDFICTSSFENTQVSLDSVIPEDGEVSTSLKKTVRFNNNVMRQLFRSNSSILGQKKKNQKKALKKKRAMERRHSESDVAEEILGQKKKNQKKAQKKKQDRNCSESEVSEVDDRKERDLNDWKKESFNISMEKKDDQEIFHLDIDN